MHHIATRPPGARKRILPVVLLGLGAAGQEAASVGQLVPDHEFTRLAGHDGRTRLAELLGQPVILAGWKRHISEGLHAAWLADTLYREFEDDGLLVVLQDREPWEGDPPWVEDVDFWYRFSGTPFWITESVQGENDPAIVREASALDVRSFVLIGVDGRLVLETRVDADDEKGYQGLKKDLQRTLREEFQKRKKGWGEDPLARRARGLAFGKDDLSGALELLDRAPEEARVPEHDEVRSEIARRFEAGLESVEFFLAEGRYLDARQALASLTDAVRGEARLAAALAPLEQRLESDDGRACLKEDKKLTRLLAPFTERELDDLDLDFLRELRAFAQQQPGSPVVERARRVDPLLTRVVRILRRIPADELEQRLRDD